MEQLPRLPGVRFEVRTPPTIESPLRTDIAGFIGPTLRGPVDEPTRIDGWRRFEEVFGGLTPRADTPYALRGYFENGGEVAYVMRMLGTPCNSATARWVVGGADSGTRGFGAVGFEAAEFDIEAATPGAWANGLRVSVRYHRRGRDGAPQVDIEVTSAHEATEYLAGLPADQLVAEVAARSRFIRLKGAKRAPATVPSIGPRSIAWDAVVLGGAIETPASEAQYVQGVNMLAAQQEVALMAAPDLQKMSGDSSQRAGIFARFIGLAEAAHDRQFVGDVPRNLERPADVLKWLKEQRALLDQGLPKSVVLYHPRLRVLDPLGGIAAPLRAISPVGHVAGVISRLDRERGAHHTPANAVLLDAVDLDPLYEPEEQAALAMGGVNPVRCTSNQGLMVWGGRTALDPTLGPTNLFVAHRRLVHRLVRAIRRVAEPLVFEVNGPDLWLALVRAITTVLLEAWRAGALQGERPEQAFLVRCDETTNPTESEDVGFVTCEVRLAPAAPMEFITLRVALSREGRLEVVEA